jgi:endothelin-converting enzyme/putative endopeptidase
MLKNSNRNVLSVGPGGVGLPDRDYYVSEMPILKKKREIRITCSKNVSFLGENQQKQNECRKDLSA